MRRIATILAAIAALTISASVLALGWEAGSRLTLVTSDGAKIVGVGSVAEVGLDLTLAAGFNGFALLMVEGPNGSLEAYDVVVGADGGILIGEDGEFVDMEQSLTDAGLAFEIAVEEDPSAEVEDRVAGGGDQKGKPDETGLDRASSKANENAAGGLERAGEVGNRAGRGAGRAVEGTPVEAEVGAEAELGAETEVGVPGSGADIGKGVGAGGRGGSKSD